MVSFLFLTPVSKYQRISPCSQGGEDTPGIEDKPRPSLLSLLPFSAMIFHTLSWAFLYIHIPAVTIVAAISKLPVRKEEVPLTFSVPLEAKTMV